MRRRRFRPSALLPLLAVVGVWGAVAGQPADPGPAAPHDAETASAVKPLPFFYDLYSFRGQQGQTDVVAAFAVRAGELQRERAGSQVQYRFDVSLVLADTALRSVTRTDDSVFVRVPRAFSGRHLLHTHVEVAAEPSGSTVQRVIMTDATEPGIGQLFGSDFAVPDYSGSDLMLSDVALGLPGMDQGWDRGNRTLALLPTSQFPGNAFDVYYEIYNLPPGHGYSTEISVQDLDEFGEPAADGRTVNTRFADESQAGDDGSLPQLRRVDSSLEEGRYRLTVTVTDEVTGDVARNHRDLRVREWGRGATLVPALPASRIRVSEDGSE